VLIHHLQNQTVDLDRLSNKEGNLCTKIELVEGLEKKSEVHQAELEILHTQFNQMQEEQEVLEFECLEIQERLRLAKVKLGEA
jgi:hypothetical protein